MALAVHPLNGFGAPALAAALGVGVGGGLYASALWLFDVAGARGWFAAQWRARGPRILAVARRGA